MKAAAVEVIKTECVSIDGVDIDVQTVKIKGQIYRIGSLSMGQVENILDPARQATGFARSWEVIADSIDEALPLADREKRDQLLARLKKTMRLPAHNALHGAVLALSGLATAPAGEDAAARAPQTSPTSAAA